MSIQSSGLVYSRVSQTFDGKLTITSGNAINGPIRIGLAFLPDGVSLANATGGDDGLEPYITVLSSGTLAPGRSATAIVQFKNRSSAKINFIPKGYSGQM